MISQNSNFIIIGPSGSGKGTQAEFISQNFGGQKHLVMGELLREIAGGETDLGKKIKKTINQGKWVEDKVVNQVIKETLEVIDKNKGVILDGYPRTVEQARYLDELFKRLDRTHPIVVNLIVLPKSVVYRLLNRKVCDKCGMLYHPPESLSETECKKCGGKLVRREDDTEEVIKKRLSEFHEKAKDVIEYYREKGKVVDIDGEPAISEVSSQIKKALEKI